MGQAGGLSGSINGSVKISQIKCEYLTELNLF